MKRTKFRRKPGPVGLFKESYVEEGYKLALLGCTERMMADWWGVKENTLTFWKRKHPEFYEAIKRGRMKADSEVAHSLFLNAITRTITTQEVHTKVTKVIENGKVVREIKEPVVVEVTKIEKGDVTAQLRWLSIRQRLLWAENVKMDVQVNGQVQMLGVIQQSGVDLSRYTTEELLALEKLGYKKIAAIGSN